MGFTNKGQYLTALLRMLPFGLLALYYGIQGLAFKTKADNLHKVYGEIIFSGTKRMFSKQSNRQKEAYVIQISDNYYDTTECYTFVTVDREKLKVLAGIKNDYIAVWCDPEIDNLIEQVEYKNQLIVEYTGHKILYLFFVLLGGVYTIITLLYLIKYPEHLYKGDKGKN